MLKLFGSPGCGSAVVEVILQIAGQPYENVKTSFRDQNEHLLTEKNPVVAKVWEKNFGK